MDKAAPAKLPMPASILFLFAAICVYALFGSPTPDNPGLVEAIVGGLLVLSIGAAGLSGSVDLRLGRNGFLTALQVMFLTGLVLPTIAGVYFGNNHMLILRDLLAFAFLGLPLFMADRFKDNTRATDFLCWLLVGAGIMFSLRTLIPAFNIWIPQGELLYLSNSPLALFAGVYLAASLWRSLESLSRANMFHVVVCLAGLGILIAAMLLDVQRATVGAIVLTWLILALFTLIKSPRRILLPLMLTGILVIAIYPLVSDALQAMATKTAQVGLNMRAQEAMAVLDTLMASKPAIFVGLGWGSVFASPAVGGLDVNYTHSLLTTMALKGGIILLILSVVVVVAALYQIMLIFQQDRVRGLSLFWPLLIPVFLYASHKSLDFGLLLLMIGVWSNQAQPLHKSHSSGNKNEHLQD